MAKAGLSAAQRRALEVVRDHGPIRPRAFAKRMWPDADGWSHRTNCGPKGVTRGGVMNLAAGGFLGKLRAKGWVRNVHSATAGFDMGYELTREGREILAAQGTDQPETDQPKARKPTFIGTYACVRCGCRVRVYDYLGNAAVLCSKCQVLEARAEARSMTAAEEWE